MKVFKELYLKNLLFYLLAGDIILFILGFFFPSLLSLAKLALGLISSLLIIEIITLFRIKNGIVASRECPERLSNGDNNDITVRIKNAYPFEIKITLIEELPEQFQNRNFQMKGRIKSDKETAIVYSVRPVKRGEYHFGATHIFVSGIFGFSSRRFSFLSNGLTKVYPSFIQLRKYDLHAVLRKYNDLGIKRNRRIGHNMEFDQIRDYVMGDDVRSLNWKATARRGSFMVNQYQDEKSQPIYCIIDKGRTMKMPFEEMTLLDYSINASLVISNIALKKEDKAGLITFNRKISTLIPAERKNNQLNRIIQTLYNEKTAFVESNNEVLYSAIKNKINQRSLLFLFTNFETLSSFKRQLPFYQKIAKNHLLVVIIFENTEIKNLLSNNVNSIEDIYNQITAEKFMFEKRLISSELTQYGILSILTSPQNLSIQLINKYLEIKSKNLL